MRYFLLIAMAIIFILGCDMGDNPVGSEWADLGIDSTFKLTKNVNITMVWIPAGEFEMGSPDDEDDRFSDEGPVHDVNIGNGFWMGKYEVTQEQWEAVTGGNPSKFDGERRPVERVSWNDIHDDFLEQIDDDFRLPSESEWEYACRAGTDMRFYWGDDPDYRDIGNYAWCDGYSNSQTHDVGQKRPNTWGLYDMIGNVQEWCEDDYHHNYNSAPLDGSPWINGPRGESRVVRSSSWSTSPSACRSADRYWGAPNGKYPVRGFRLVLDR